MSFHSPRVWAMPFASLVFICFYCVATASRAARLDVGERALDRFAATGANDTADDTAKRKTPVSEKAKGRGRGKGKGKGSGRSETRPPRGAADGHGGRGRKPASETTGGTAQVNDTRSSAKETSPDPGYKEFEGPPPGRTWVPPPRFFINLDLPPEQRWTHVMVQYLPQLKLLQKIHDSRVSGVLSEYGIPGNKLPISHLSNPPAGLANIATVVPIDAEIKGELRGMAKITKAAGLDYYKLYFMNLGYDFQAHCTTAVVKCPSGGPVHLRNLDWDEVTMWPFSIYVEFQKGGKTIYEGPTWVGFAGLVTGYRTNSWSVSLNFRKSGSSTQLVNNVWQFLARGGWPAFHLIRNTLHNTATYKEAVQIFSSARLMAPCYFVLAGSAPTHGIVIERSRAGADACQTLDMSIVGSCKHPTKEDKAVIVSNLDYSKKTFDLTEDSKDMTWTDGDALLISALLRRQTAESVIGKMDPQKVCSTKAGFKMWGTAPVMNDQTITTSVIRPSEGIQQTRLIYNWLDYTTTYDRNAYNDYLQTPTWDKIDEMQLPTEKPKELEGSVQQQ